MMRGLISELDIFQQEILGGDHMHAIT